MEKLRSQQFGKHCCRQQIPSMNLYSRASCFAVMPPTGNAAGVCCKGHSTPPERAAGSSWSKLGTTVLQMLFFPLLSKPMGSETAQCSPRAPRGGLSEELDMACTDLGFQASKNLFISYKANTVSAAHTILWLLLQAWWSFRHSSKSFPWRKKGACCTSSKPTPHLFLLNPARLKEQQVFLQTLSAQGAAV